MHHECVASSSAKIRASPSQFLLVDFQQNSWKLLGTRWTGTQKNPPVESFSAAAAPCLGIIQNSILLPKGRDPWFPNLWDPFNGVGRAQTNSKKLGCPRFGHGYYASVPTSEHLKNGTLFCHILFVGSWVHRILEPYLVITENRHVPLFDWICLFWLMVALTLG